MHSAVETEKHRKETERSTDRAAPHRGRLVADLEARIRELEAHDERDFGGFTRLDWAILLLGAIVVPGVLLLWFAP